MKLVTIDADKLHWMEMTGGALKWVNEVDFVNAIMLSSLRELQNKIDAAYEDGYDNGYDQAKFDYKPQQGHWIYESYITSDGDEEEIEYCSECKSSKPFGYNDNYCPCCDANMRGEK